MSGSLSISARLYYFISYSRQSNSGVLKKSNTDIPIPLQRRIMVLTDMSFCFGLTKFEFVRATDKLEFITHTCIL